MSRKVENAGVYVHIPFCVQKCFYCDFLSFASTAIIQGSDVSLQKEIYVDALIKEIAMAQHGNKIPYNIDSVYIGGGTPTVLPPFLLCKIIEAIKDFYLIADCEITVEANPGTLTREYLIMLKKAGVNRLSIGLQTIHEKHLKAIGRVHSYDDFVENFKTAREVGFDNINVDLMFALPNQTLFEWQETINKVINLSPEHISAYSLTPAESTSLWEGIENGSLKLPNDELDRMMYHFACKRLKEAGFLHYEISNFAKSNKKSRHNVNCWRLVPYYGFGLGAHSFDGKSRSFNHEKMSEYLKLSFEKQGVIHLSNEDLMAEAMILGLRLNEGISEKELSEKFHVNPFEIYKNQIQKLIKSNLILKENGVIKLTPLGYDLANQVFESFL